MLHTRIGRSFILLGQILILGVSILSRLCKQASILSKRTLLALGLLCICLSFKSYAVDTPNAFYGDDDTILVEKTKRRFSYSKAFKSFSKHVLKFDIDSLLSGGKNCRDSVIHNFSDLADRTKYRLNLKQDLLELKLTLNF